MKITIRDQFKPFSHRMGAMCLIPGTGCVIKAFPTRIEIGESVVLDLALNGPIAGFTLQQDLEKHAVYLFGRAKEGFFRLHFKASAQGISILADRLPKLGILINGKRVLPKETLVFPMDLDFFLPQVLERLSLGMNKAQDWDLVLRRFDLKEILPVLFCLSQQVPPQKIGPCLGAAKLLETGDLEALCKAGFSHLLVPRLFDDEYQGLSPQEGKGIDALFLLQEIAKRVRSLFFEQEGNCLKILPESLFPSGRMVSIQVNGIGELNLEWASFSLRRAILHAQFSESLFFKLQKGLTSFRIRTVRSGRGRRHQVADPLFIEKGTTYYLDRFQRHVNEF